MLNRLPTLPKMVLDENGEVTFIDVIPSNHHNEKLIDLVSSGDDTKEDYRGPVPCLLFKECGRFTHQSQYCPEHLRSELGLEIKKSTLPGNVGKGLFASRAIYKPDKVIDYYVGDIIPAGKAKNNYLIDTGIEGLDIDAADPTSCAARFANTLTQANINQGLQYNTVLTTGDLSAPTGSIKFFPALTALRNIKKGEELFTPYSIGGINGVPLPKGHSYYMGENSEEEDEPRRKKRKKASTKKKHSNNNSNKSAKGIKTINMNRSYTNVGLPKISGTGVRFLS